MEILLGVCAFALFFLSDYNDWKLAKRGLNWCFPAGAGILAVATVWGISGGTPYLTGWPRGLFFVLAALFLGLLIDVLFFALPAQASMPAPARRGAWWPRDPMPCAGIRGSGALRGCTAACGRLRDCRCGRRQCIAD